MVQWVKMVAFDHMYSHHLLLHPIIVFITILNSFFFFFFSLQSLLCDFASFITFHFLYNIVILYSF